MPESVRKVCAFFVIYVVWGSTYLAIRVGLESMPPFLMAGCRFLVAGTILCGIAIGTGARPPTWHQARPLAVVGCLLFFGANGLVTWGEQSVPSGITSILVATAPFWMNLFDWVFFGGPRPTRGVVASIVLGFSGVVVLMRPAAHGLGELPVDPIGGLAILMAAVCWTSGSLYARDADLPDSLALTSGLEMYVATIPLLATSYLSGEWQEFSIEQLTSRSVWALAYLIIFGAVIAFLAYLWLLNHTTPSMLATYAFVNPLVAVSLGWLLLNEEINHRLLIATGLIVAAIVTLWRSKRS